MSPVVGHMDEFAVSVQIRQGCQVVSIVGDLDADTAPLLEFELDRLLGGLPVLIELAGVSLLYLGRGGGAAGGANVRQTGAVLS